LSKTILALEDRLKENQEASKKSNDDILEIFNKQKEIPVQQKEYLWLTQNEEQTEIAESWTFSSVDRQEVIEGSRLLKFNRNDFVLKYGEDSSRCFYVLDTGSCYVLERGEPSETLRKNDLFGLENFLCPSKICADVISADDKTKVICVEGYYLDVLFAYNLSLSSRFYLYLATRLSRKIESYLSPKNKDNSTTENSISTQYISTQNSTTSLESDDITSALSLSLSLEEIAALNEVFDTSIDDTPL